MRIVGIDQGTTSTRALSVNSTGNLDVLHSIEHQQIYPHDGWVEHDPEELIRNIRICVNAAGRADDLDCLRGTRLSCLRFLSHLGSLRSVR